MKWHRLIHETAQKNIESFYFWSMNCLTDLGSHRPSRSQMYSRRRRCRRCMRSAQRLGLAQDKVAQYLATIGRLVKDLFQIVREIRWIRERKNTMRIATGADEKSACLERSPSRMYVDLVEGGTSAGSVYGWARRSDSHHCRTYSSPYTLRPQRISTRL